MAVVKATSSDAEGVQGMMLVGNVGINPLRANCSDFKGLRTIFPK